MIKESFRLYNTYLIQILMLSVILVVPLSLFVHFAIFYLNDWMIVDQYPSLYALFLIVINFTLLIPVFRELAITDLEDLDEITIKQLCYIFIKHFGFIVFVTIPLYIIAVYGVGLFFIPTVICVVMILLIPFFVHYDKIKDVFRQVGKVLMNENIFLLIDLLIIISFQLLAWGVMVTLFANFDSSYYVYGIARAIINALIFPIIIFYLTMRYREVELSQ